ncbi:MAG: ASCH domain-containing protein [Alphaproteobacteria bacterium]|nr:ASCH domain-containing protein [Alphaproteobacteria bacterium]
MRMRLHPEPFEAIKSGLKTIEMRLLDEKRQAIKLDDEITFVSRVTAEELTAKVKDLKVYQDFAELYDNEKELVERYGSWSKQEFVDSFDEYYSEKLKEGYKSLSIHFELV